MAFFEPNSSFSNGGPGDDKRKKAVEKANEIIDQRNYAKGKKYEKLTGKLEKLKSNYDIVIENGKAK